MTKIDENIQTAQNMLNGIIERCYELEEENKKLKKENRRLREIQIYGKTVEERIEYDKKVFRE